MSANEDRFDSAKVLPEDVEIRYDKVGVIVAHVKNLTSHATSLGASSPAPTVVKMAIERKGGVKCVSVPDEMAMYAADSFAGVLR